MSIDVGTRRLQFIDTPGHALHHHCIWDERTQGWFTGDSFGISYRDFDTAPGAWILVSSTPVQFDPVLLSATVQRLLERQPRCMYLTHYGRVGDVPRLGADLLRMLQRMVDIGRSLQAAPQRDTALRKALLALYLDGLRAHGDTHAVADIETLLAVDLQLNAQGLGIWLDRQTARPA